jgi:CBS domain-containing protein
LIDIGIISFIGGDFIGGMWQFLIGMFLRNAAQMSYQHVLIRQALEGEPVARFMRQDVVTVEPSTSVRQLVEDYVYKHHHKLYPVTDNGTLLGSITTRDIQKIPRNEWNQRSVRELVAPATDINTISPDTDAMEALSSMNRNGASRMIVVRDGHLEGIL